MHQRLSQTEGKKFRKDAVLGTKREQSETVGRIFYSSNTESNLLIL